MKSFEVELNFLSEFDVIFWNIDGVIKESEHVKAEAYAVPFNRHGIRITSVNERTLSP